MPPVAEIIQWWKATTLSRGKKPRRPSRAAPFAARARDVGASHWYLAMVQDVYVNGETRSVEEGSTVASLLQSLGLQSHHVAVERNREIVPRDAHAVTPVSAGDRLEIVTFVGGG